MNTLDTIRKRRSTRSFESKQVERELVDKIVEAGLYAPSAKNTQTPIILVVQDKDLREKIVRVNASILNSTNDTFYGAPTILIVLYKKEISNGIYDASLVLQNMMLAAEELGLGSCWIHRAKEEFEMDEFKSLLKSLGLNDEYEGVGHLALGYIKNKNEGVKEIKENRVFYL